MCEKCEENEKRDEIKKALSCSKCSSGINVKEPEIVNINREIVDQKAESEKIDEEMKKRHIELINGYDKQLEDCLRDIAIFSTKMLLMFEDYKRKGDTEGMVKLLQSMANYGIMTQTTATVIIQSTNMLIGKVRSHGT